MYNPSGDKTIIRCSRCRNSLRVPADKGRILVTCPVCRREFTYTPNQLSLWMNYFQNRLAGLRLPGFKLSPQWVRKNRTVLIIAGILLLLLLFYLLFGQGTAPQGNGNPNLL